MQTIFWADERSSERLAADANSWRILNRLLTFLFLFWIVCNVAVLKTIQIINKKMSNRFKLGQLLHQLQAFCDPKSLLKRVWNTLYF